MHTQIEINQLNQIIGRITPGAMVLRAWPLEGGISAQMTGFEVEAPDGKVLKYVIRQASSLPSQTNQESIKNEFRLLKQLQTIGIKSPNPLLFDSSCTVLLQPFLVLEFIEGTIDFNPKNLSQYLREMAQALADLHKLDLDQLDVSFLPIQTTSDLIEDNSSEDSENGLMNEGQIREALQHAPIKLGSNKPVLLHGDFWPGNLLWCDGKLAGIIDWEDAMVGEPLWDLAITRLDVVCIFGIEAMREFTAHYSALMQIDFKPLCFWDLAAALRFIRMAGVDLAGWAEFYIPYGRSDITELSIQTSLEHFVKLAIINTKNY